MSAAAGTSQLFGLTVTVGSLLTLTTMVGLVFYVFESSEELEPATIRAIEGGDELHLLVAEGSPLPLDAASLELATSDGFEQRTLTDLQDSFGTHWGPGEPLCVAGAAPTCVTPLRRSMVFGLDLVIEGQTVFTWENSELPVEPPKGGGPDPMAPEGPGTADLRAWLVGPEPATAEEGRALRWTARVANNGTADTSDSFEVRFYLDGELLSARTISPLQADGLLQVMSASWTPTAGQHTIAVVVDEPGAVDDLDRTNNRASWTFTVEG